MTDFPPEYIIFLQKLKEKKLTTAQEEFVLFDCVNQKGKKPNPSGQDPNQLKEGIYEWLN